MKNKYRDWTYIILGLVWMIAGIILIVFKHSFVEKMAQIISIGVSVVGLIKLFGVLSIDKYGSSTRTRFLQFILALGHFIFAAWLFAYQEHTTELLVKIVGGYQLLIGAINFISYILMFRDKARQRLHRLLFAIVHLVFGVSSLTANDQGENALVRIGIYAIFIGITYWNDGRRVIIPPKTEEHIKRHIRVPLPVIFDAFLPQKLVRKINAYIEGEINLNEKIAIPTYDVSEPKNNGNKIMQIAVHSSPHDIDIIGHVNITYDDIIYSYGNHDVDSRFLFGAVGDGTLVKVNRREYLEFTMARDVTVVEYDIVLNQTQQKVIEQKLSELDGLLIPWKPNTKTQLASYGGELMRRTHAEFFKFKASQYRTYFVFWTNCVLLSDEIVGSSGLDILALVGVMTPGTYYDYLEKEYHKEYSIVVGKRVYNRKLKDYESNQRFENNAMPTENRLSDSSSVSSHSQ